MIMSVILLVVGGIWILQGLDVLGGSGMSGKTLWAILGPVIALVGVAILVAGLRTRGARRP